MTVLSAQTIRKLRLVRPCRETYFDIEGNSAGLSCCGYDLTLYAEITILPGQFVLTAAAELLYLPNNIVGKVHDKSSLARRGLAVQNTVAEPGWFGYLTLELTNHGMESLYFQAGRAICQIVFEFLDEPTEFPYKGKYQNQGSGPQLARRGKQ